MPEQPTVHDSVAALTRGLLSDMSASERKVGRALLAAYPVAGLETVAQLADRAGVSPPTVLRYAARLGFGGFPDLQRALMREVNERMGSPLEQYPGDQAPQGRDGVPDEPAQLGKLIRDTFAEVASSELEAAARLLADTKRHVVITSGHFSRSLAEHLNFHLLLARDHVRILSSDDLELRSVIASTTRSRILVVFDFRRYDRRSEKLARAMSERGAKIILFTDSWLSPIAGDADVVLPAFVETPSGFDSLVAASGLVEHVFGAVARELDDRGRKRLAEFERIRERFEEP